MDVADVHGTSSFSGRFSRDDISGSQKRNAINVTFFLLDGTVAARARLRRETDRLLVLP